jgi:hypothetical protein
MVVPIFITVGSPLGFTPGRYYFDSNRGSVYSRVNMCSSPEQAENPGMFTL